MARTVKKKGSFEENLAALEQIVQELEKGDVPLDTLLEKYTAGIALSRECLGKLEDTEQAMDKLLGREGEEVTEKPLFVQEES